MKQNRSLHQGLPDYIPEAAVDTIADWFITNKTVLNITRDRRSKLGDFRSARNGNPPIITVNHNLNKYAFLITLLHEMAHANVYRNNKKRVAPHGTEWKKEFRAIAMPYAISGIFPSDISEVFIKYLENPTASSTSSVSLASVLRNYDTGTSETLVSMLAPETHFVFGKNRVFKMIGKVRTRYKCYCVSDKRTYLFSPMAPVIPLDALKTNTDH
jgi:SprT protein